MLRAYLLLTYIGLLFIGFDLSANQNIRIGILNLDKYKLYSNKQWQLTNDYLEKQLPHHQISLVYLNLKTLENAIRQQKIDFLITDAGQFSNLKYRYSNQIIPLATRVLHYQQQASPYVHSVIFTHQDSHIETFADISNHRFASLSPNAFADYQIALHTLKKHKIKPNKDFSQQLHLNISPVDLIDKVINKEIDIASLSSHHFSIAINNTQFDYKKLKILQENGKAKIAGHGIYSSEPYPDYIFIGFKYIPKNIILKIKQKLINMPIYIGKLKSEPYISWQAAINYEKVIPNINTEDLIVNNNYKQKLHLYLLWSMFLAGVVSIIILLVSNQVISHTIRILIIPFTLLMVLGLSLLLGWLVEQWSDNFYTRQIQLAHSSVQGASNSISRHIEQIYSRLSILIVEKEEILREIISFPDDIENNHMLREIIYKRFDNIVAFSLIDMKNQILFSEGKHKIGVYCKQNINKFSQKLEKYGYNELTVHGNNKNNYHFDVMIKVKLSTEEEAILFVSIKLDYIMDALLHLELPGQSLLLVPYRQQYQIDVSSHGIHYSPLYNSSLTDDDMQRVLYDTAVQNTGWQLLAIADKQLFSNYANNLWQRMGLIYFVLLLILGLFIWGLLREEKKRVYAQTELKQMYASLEAKVIDRTHSLTKLNKQLREQITERRQIERNLHINQERLKFALVGSNDGLWDWNISSGQIYLSPRWQEMLGYPQGKLRGHIDTWKFLLHPDDKDQVLNLLQQHLRGETNFYEAEHRIAHKNGHYVWVLTRGKVMERDSNKQPLRAVGTQIDLTERKQAETALFEEKERAQVTLHSIADGVITTDAQGRVQYLNPVAEKMTAWSIKEAKNQLLSQVFQVFCEKNRKPALNPVLSCLSAASSGEKTKDSLLINRNGKEFAIEESTAPIQGRQGEILGAVLVFHDVSQERHQARKIAYQASHDLLTGLVNRGEFEKRLKQALQQSRQNKEQHALCYIDLDKFKQVNDSAGHYAGDHILQVVTRLLKEEIREKDTLGRLGGDEFALLLRHCPLLRAQKIAQNMVTKINKYPFNYQDQHFNLGLSIGLVSIQADSPDFKTLINQADKACYNAKYKGRSCLVIWEELQTVPSSEKS